MPVNLTDLNNAIATLRSTLNTGDAALNTPTSTSENFTGNAASITTAVSGIQSVFTAGGLDSDLLTQQAALEAAMAAGGDALAAALKQLAVLTPGSTWPPNAGPNVIDIWRD